MAVKREKDDMTHSNPREHLIVRPGVIIHY